MTVKIIADSSCDLSDEIITDLDIDILNIKSVDEFQNLIDVSFTMDEFFEAQRNGHIFKTSQVTTYDYLMKFEQYAKSGIDFICITLSSGMSGGYQNAVMALRSLRERYPNVKMEIVDSLAASVGNGLITYYMAKASKSGMGFDMLIEFSKFLVSNVGHLFTVFDLKYLYSGGRVSRTKAKISDILNILPILEVDEEGKIFLSEVVRGKNKAYKRMSEILVKNTTGTNDVVFPVYGNDYSILTNFLKRIEKLGFNNYIPLQVGTIIASHVGPDIVGLSYLFKEIPHEYRSYVYDFNDCY